MLCREDKGAQGCCENWSKVGALGVGGRGNIRAYWKIALTGVAD